jgi:hypothetical protein
LDFVPTRRERQGADVARLDRPATFANANHTASSLFLRNNERSA